jgi:hypothetical protein
MARHERFATIPDLLARVVPGALPCLCVCAMYKRIPIKRLCFHSLVTDCATFPLETSCDVSRYVGQFRADRVGRQTHLAPRVAAHQAYQINF